MKTIHIQYYAILREQRGISQESLQTECQTVGDLYIQLQSQYQFSLPMTLIRFAINHEFKDAQTLLNNKDHVVFIPPVAGG